MNKTDMEKAAKRLEELGKDPDLVYAYTLEEYAAMHEDEVDTYDEDVRAIKDLSSEVEETCYEIDDLTKQIEDIEQQIIEQKAELDRLNDEMEKARKRNYLEYYEYKNEYIPEEERELSKLVNKQELLKAKLDLLITKRDGLAQQLATLREEHHSKYTR